MTSLPLDAHLQTLRMLLSVLLLRLSHVRPDPVSSAPADDTFRRYSAALEDARVLLEAKRLLVHTDATAADISRTLGFAEPTDFAKFFRKRDGRTPLEFRAMARGQT
ncbi:helix-turn-helix domain-containing protein [Streptomyces sp. NPDC002276]